MLKSERFGYIMNLATKEQYDFQQVVKRGLMRAVVSVGVVSPDKSYWSQTVQLLQNRFKQITTNRKFSQCFHQEEIKVQIIDILESFIGKLLPIFTK